MANTTLYTTADAFIKKAFPGSNYGSSDTIWILTLNLQDARCFLKFDLSGLPAGATITLARLRVKCYQVMRLIAGVTDVQARRVADDSWTELGITWNNQKAYGVVEDTVVPAVGWVEWDITGFVQAEWAGDKIVSVCLRCVQESYDAENRGGFYRSKEYDGDDPELYIEYTAGVDHFKTVTEILGLADSYTRKATFHKTTTELLGLVDTYDKNKCKKCKPSVTLIF